MEALFNPALILFLSGIVVGLVFKILFPDSLSKFLGYYLLFALGLKGGQSLQKNGFTDEVLSVLSLGVFFAMLIPLISYLYLKNILNTEDAAALAGTYGSVSAVTYVTALTYLSTSSQNFDNFMSAVLVVMEFPAIFMALYLVTRKYAGNKNNIEFISSIPSCDFEISDTSNLFSKQSSGNYLTRFLKQITMIFNALGSDGGLFVLIGKKR